MEVLSKDQIVDAVYNAQKNILVSDAFLKASTETKMLFFLFAGDMVKAMEDIEGKMINTNEGTKFTEKQLELLHIILKSCGKEFKSVFYAREDVVDECIDMAIGKIDAYAAESIEDLYGIISSVTTQIDAEE